ncbi:hypothetical protein TSUD_07780 [Trifolium subterraneum]|uniref:Uncharacterized protein n=1 Tax=Trifolium subterraneum TaxID=3900 RepID=A0A2Z6MNL9_TRISU|nr:hypothetical protein TSUD_07780 [Trifolium subterraneum]
MMESKVQFFTAKDLAAVCILPDEAAAVAPPSPAVAAAAAAPPVAALATDYLLQRLGCQYSTADNVSVFAILDGATTSNPGLKLMLNLHDKIMVLVDYTSS